MLSFYIFDSKINGEDSKTMSKSKKKDYIDKIKEKCDISTKYFKSHDYSAWLTGKQETALSEYYNSKIHIIK